MTSSFLSSLLLALYVCVCMYVCLSVCVCVCVCVHAYKGYISKKKKKENYIKLSQSQHTRQRFNLFYFRCSALLLLR